MNREIKRRLKREQESSDRTTRARPPVPQQRKERLKLRQFVREVQIELRRVIWPTRQEVITYSIVVLIVVVVLTAVVFVMDLGFAKAVFELFKPNAATGAALPRAGGF